MFNEYLDRQDGCLILSHNNNDTSNKEKVAGMTCCVCVNTVQMPSNEGGPKMMRPPENNNEDTLMGKALAQLSAARSEGNGCGGEKSFGELVAKTLHGQVGGFPNLLALVRSNSDGNAVDTEVENKIIDDDDDSSSGGAVPHPQPTTHRELHAFLSEDFDLGEFGIGVGDAVGVVMPNGPVLAVAVLSVMAHATCAPVNASNTVEEIEAELQDVGAKAVLIMAGEGHQEALTQIAHKLGITAIVANPRPDKIGLFSMTAVVRNFPAGLWQAPSQRLDCVQAKSDRPVNQPESVALMLRTSGSSGKPKLVPTRLGDLIVAAACTAAVLELKPHDVGLNVMPMFHMGGIHRNLLAPLLAGSGMVYMPFFDPGSFWDLYASKGCTWYHGVPSIHAAIVDALLPRSALKELDGAAKTAAARQAVVSRGLSIKFVTNAGAALSHAQAEELATVYGAAVLPCYGMSECGAVACPGLSYRLEKPGSVGKVMAAAVIVRDGSGNEQPAAGTVGEICLAGPPTFPGYINRATGEISPVEGGIFPTGDMGYVDAEGYLYLTGRCKEVINRGGEIISPLEVEEVFLAHPAIAKVAAFSAVHKELQETVGIMVVLEPGCQRPSKGQLTEWAGSRLAPPKWPFCVVYADKGLPVSSANKVVRIGMAERLGLPEFSNDSPDHACHFETVGALPDPREGNKSSIGCQQVSFDLPAVEAAVEASGLLPGGAAAIAVTRELRKTKVVVVYIETSQEALDHEALVAGLEKRLPGYMLPAAPMAVKAFPRLPDGSVDTAALPDASGSDTGYLAPSNPAEETIQAIFMDVLGPGAGKIGCADDLFALGGTSIQAGAVGFRIRDAFGVPANGALLYECRTVKDLARHVMMKRSNPGVTGASSSIRQQRSRSDDSSSLSDGSDRCPTYFDALQRSDRRRSSASLAAMTVHWLTILYLPMCITYVNWLVLGGGFALLKDPFMNVVQNALMHRGSEVDRILALVAIILLARLAMCIYLPLLSISVKWVVIGRFKPGRRALWGGYYLRWWIVDQFRRATGLGIFSSSPFLLRTYYRLMGARIGKNVIIDRTAVITECDLVTLEEDCIVDSGALVRPGAADCGDFLLAPIACAAGCCVSKKTTLAPGTVLPEGTCLRPCSSSWEADAADPKYRALCSPTRPSPPWWALAPIGWLLVALPYLVGWSPVLVLLYVKIDVVGDLSDGGGWQGLLNWVLQWEWLALYFASKVMSTTLTPFLRLFTVIALKHTCNFRYKPGPKPGRKTWAALGQWWLGETLRDGLLCGVAPLINVHSEMHSALLRMLGAKVGKHVYWPLSGLITSMHDLVEVGDDAVWGAHHSIVTVKGNKLMPVKIGPGANPLDRCILGPGCVIGRNALVGTGSFVDAEVNVPDGAVFLGDSTLEVSAARAKADTIKPYGMAHGKATYWLVPDLLWPLVLVPLRAASTIVPKAPFMAALWAMQAAVGGEQGRLQADLWLVLLLLMLFTSLMNVAFKFLGILIDVAAKWAIIGHRVAGPHPFNTSSYSQRWHFYLSFHAFSRPGLEYAAGTAMAPWYFRMMGGDIGSDVCYFDGVGPMMTREADLTSIGDNTCINTSIIRCHSNAFGNFELQPCTIGKRVTLRSQSAVQGGAKIEDDAVLLEDTLAMPGETVRVAKAMQGWPADVLVPARTAHDKLEGIIKEDDGSTATPGVTRAASRELDSSVDSSVIGAAVAAHRQDQEDDLFVKPYKSALGWRHGRRQVVKDPKEEQWEMFRGAWRLNYLQQPKDGSAMKLALAVLTATAIMVLGFGLLYWSMADGSPIPSAPIISSPWPYQTAVCEGREWKYSSPGYRLSIIADIPDEADYLNLNRMFSPCCPGGFNSTAVNCSTAFQHGCGQSIDRAFDIFDVCADDDNSTDGYHSEGLQVKPGCQKVFATYPEAYDCNTPVIFVLHGDMRDAWNHAADATWKKLRGSFLFRFNYTLSDVILVAPYFDKTNFQLYSTGGVYRPSDGSIRPEEDWYFSWIPRVFDALRVRQALNTNRYSVLGYSAGAQFSHRMLILGEVDERLYWTVTGAPSTWTFTNRTDVAYPYGLAGEKLEGVRRRLPVAFGRRHSVFVGEMDTVSDGVIALHPEAEFQGSDRLERAAKFSIDAAYKSGVLGAGGHEWTFNTIPNAGHNDGSSQIWEQAVMNQGFPFYPEWRGNNWLELTAQQQQQE